MQRRSLMRLGAASALLLLAGGGALTLLEPGLRAGKLTPAGRDVFAAVGRAVLDGVLPTEASSRAAAMEGLLSRVDALIAGLPPHAQAELGQLLALLASVPGRHTLAGLSVEWTDASVRQLTEALQTMRHSRLEVRRQAYQALHDIVGGAYFSEPAAWAALGYPGPVAI